MPALRPLLILMFALFAGSATAQENLPWSRGGRVPDPSVRLDAQDLADRIGVACRVGRAEARGMDADRAAQFEVTCAEGPGYLLVDGARPRALDCLSLEASRLASDGRSPGCRIAANRDPVPVIAPLAREAGIGCRVDGGALRGRTPTDGTLYEVGCAGEDGFWLERAATGWTVSACLKVVSQGGACRFTTPAEQVATVRRWLAGGLASGCDVAEARFMGQGRGDQAGTELYEARCRSGDGWLVRAVSEPDGPPRRVVVVYPCAEAGHIGGGCRLTHF
ncbi:hypothetical protein [Brevundimonas goettingensis]|uniref:Uncharacterized protein n=1 Tax=Brevundimonas goettingensis TaxID=2774190 RepID=A0A975C6Y3_9CAUL|nr:hypothetical protein [Brevundimonas goettingensis]QTC93120.1 hypothetical protein IFJ75_09915 [Brevundimonas goettingensis]